MSDKKTLYGDAPISEIGRKTWNREEMLEKARQRQEAARDEIKARYERAPTPPDAQEIEARRSRLNLDHDLNKVTLVPAGASAVGKRGKGAGYYCQDCDLTFKDSLQWVDHLNSKQRMYLLLSIFLYRLTDACNRSEGVWTNRKAGAGNVRRRESSACMVEAEAGRAR